MPMQPLLGNIIRERRKLIGLTLEEVAKKTGFSRGHISYVETGRTKSPSFYTMILIADALNVNIISFVDLDSESTIFKAPDDYFIKEYAKLDKKNRLFMRRVLDALQED